MYLGPWRSCNIDRGSTSRSEDPIFPVALRSTYLVRKNMVFWGAVGARTSVTVSQMTTTFFVSCPGYRKIVSIIYLDRLTPQSEHLYQYERSPSMGSVRISDLISLCPPPLKRKISSLASIVHRHQEFRLASVIVRRDKACEMRRFNNRMRKRGPFPQL